MDWPRYSHDACDAMINRARAIARASGTRLEGIMNQGTTQKRLKILGDDEIEAL